MAVTKFDVKHDGWDTHCDVCECRVWGIDRIGELVREKFWVVANEDGRYLRVVCSLKCMEKWIADYRSGI